MINKLLYVLGLLIAMLLASTAAITASAQIQAEGQLPPAGFVQTSPESAVYCTNGMIYMIVVLDEQDGVKPIAPPVGTPCSPEKLAQVPGGAPGIFTSPSEGFVVVFTGDDAWTGHIVAVCSGSTLIEVTAFEGSNPRVMPTEYSSDCEQQ